MTELFKGAHKLWSIWVHMNLKNQMQVKLHPDNILLMQMYKKNESENIRTSNVQLCIILNDNYKKSDLNKLMKNQCQNLI